MKTGSVIKMVGIHCPPEMEERFNQWYDEHVSHLFQIPQLQGATRYRIGELTTPVAPDTSRVLSQEEYPNYLTIYEFESEEAWRAYENSPERTAFNAQMMELWKEGGFTLMWGGLQYQAIKTWRR